MLAPTANSLIALAAIAIALWLRPWRVIGAGGPPWAWVVAWATTPLLWGLDRYADVPLIGPMSGAGLLVLLAGWPLTVLAFVPIAVVTVACGDLGWIEGLHRLVWLGVVPATLALGIGAAVRRWMPNHLYVYIMGRGFIGTLLATVLSSGVAFALFHRPMDGDDLFVARLLLGMSEAFLTGAVTASLVASQPSLLATYSDRLYLPCR
jgi:uncharacterized membrane protein